MEELQGRVVVVTGAGSGVGRGLAQGFAEAGARLVLADVDREGMEETRKLLGDSAESVAVETDVTSQASVDALARSTLDAFGAVHVLCNNAGVAFSGYLWEHSLEDWDWITNVNVRGVIHGIRSFVPIFLERGEPAHVVNTSSMLGLHSAPLTGPYVMTKHAVLALSECLRLDLQTKGANVGVSVLCPGPVRTRVNEERGRPPRSAPSGEVDPQIAAIAEAMRGVVASGLDPAEVGRCVVEGVRAGRFFHFPSPEYVPGARLRLDEIEREQGNA